MRYLKLFLISAFVFGTVIFLISLLFPSVTYVSRAANIAGSIETSRATLPARCSSAFDFMVPDTRFTQKPGNDTVEFSNQHVRGGMALYSMSSDSSTLQVFYKIVVPWYQPWSKFALMVNEEKYGPSLDSALRKARR